MAEIADRNKIALFDWFMKNIPHQTMDAILDFMYTDNRELHDILCPPDDEPEVT